MEFRQLVRSSLIMVFIVPSKQIPTEYLTTTNKTQHKYPQLLEDRFIADRPFPIHDSGFDHFGPFDSRIADEKHERYALIFTSFTYNSRRPPRNMPKRTSICHLDISTLNESPTAEDGSGPTNFQTMFGPA